MAEKLFCPLVNAFIVVGSSLDSLELGAKESLSSLVHTPQVLECYPIDQKDGDVVQSMPMFCLSDGIQFTMAPKEPVFFANTLTMGNGDRHYSFCLKFWDEVSQTQSPRVAKKTTLPKSSTIFSLDDIDKSPMTERMPEDYWKRSCDSTEPAFYKQFSRGNSLSDIGGQAILSPQRAEGHPLGELGTSLDEQLKYAKKLQESDHSSDTSEDIGPELNSIESVVTKKTRIMRRLGRRGSQFEISKLPQEKKRSLSDKDADTPMHVERSISMDDTDILYSLAKEEPNESDNASVTSIESVEGQIFYTTKALILLSKFPLCHFFKEYLTQIYEYVISRPKGKCKMIPVERYISNLLFEVIIPPPGNDLRLLVHGPISPLPLFNPAYNDLPLLDISLQPLLLSLDRKNLIQVFIGLTLERKFLFTSSNTGLLYQCTHALLFLLYPFEWQTGFVPVVPPSLLELTQALTPIILGIPAKYIDELEVPEDMIIVDLDNNIVTIADEHDLPHVPTHALSNLKKHLKKLVFPQLRQLGSITLSNQLQSGEELREAERKNEEQIRLCFLAFYVYLFRDIRKFVNVELGDTEDVFDIEFFLNTQVTSFQEFWDVMMHTRMFEIFTQKLANKAESRTSMGLFVELAAKTIGCSDATEVFDIVLSHSARTKAPSLDINMNNPRSSETVTRNWNPLHFPTLDPELCVRPEYNSSALLEIKHALRKTKSAQLHLLHAHVLMQKYHQSRNIKDAHNALCSCMVAIEIDPLFVSTRYISSLLEIFSSDDLEKIAATSTGPIAKETRDILENRKYSVLSQMMSEMEGAETSEEGAEEEPSDDVALGVSLEFTDPSLGIIDSSKKNLLALQFPKKNSICSRSLIRTLLDAKLVSDDPIIHSKLLFILQTKKGSVPRKNLTRYLKCMEQVLSDCLAIKEKYKDVLGPNEIGLFSSTANSRSGKSGHLLITQERLLFLSKGRILRDIRLENIGSVESHTYQLLIPGGMPCVKIRTHEREFLYGIWSSWSPSHLRDIWVRYIADMASAWKMALDLKDPQIIYMAVQNFILSAALTKRHGKSAPPGCFQYLGECFPNHRWFNIPLIFQKRGMLNIDNECEMSIINNQLGSVVQMLQMAVQLIHTHRVDGNSDHYVDFTALKQSKEFRAFSKLTYNLQRFSLDSLSKEDTTVLFVNLYNILVLHAYMELEHFPANVWEWKYMERFAYYTIGGVAYSLWDMHHGILRHNKPSPGGRDVPFYANDPRLALVQQVICDPCILFTLSNHTTYSPAVFRLEASSLKEDLQQARTLFCQNTISFSQHRIKIPQLFKVYYSEFIIGEYSQEKLLFYVKRHLTSVQRKYLESIQHADDFEIEWLCDWTPSAKVLVGAV